MEIGVIWAGLILFSMLMVVLGYMGYKKTQLTMEDFVLGGRKLGIIAAFFTTTATMFSAFSYFGIMGWYYSHGVGTWALVSNISVLGLLIVVAGARTWYLGKKYGYLNVTDYLSDRYQDYKVGTLAAVITVVSIVPYIGAQFRGSGITLESFSGGVIPYWAGAVFLAIVVAIYVMAGGFRGVVWTDIAQGVVMYTVLIAAMFIIVGQVSGSFTALITDAAAVEPQVLSYPGPLGVHSSPFLFSLIILFAFTNFTMPQYQQRYMAVRNYRTLKYLAVFFFVGTAIIYIAGFYIAMAGRVHLPDIANPEAVYPTLIGTFLPPWLGVLALVGILSATGSTGNSLSLTISSIITRDIYEPYFAKGRDVNEKTVTQFSRMLIPILIGAALLVAFFGPPSVIGILVDITWPALFMVCPAHFAGLYWRRATGTAAWISMLVGLGSFMAIRLGWWAPNLRGLHPAILPVILAIIAMVGISLITAPPNKEHVNKFFKDFETRGQRETA